jgi:hypothetical protein
MRKPEVIDEVRRRLVRSGFSRRYAQRTADELYDHWSDLVEEAIRQGHAQSEAEVEANQRIGEAAALAEDLAARLKKSSWLGRNPTFAFGALALFTTILWWVVFGLATASWTGLLMWNPKIPGSVPPQMDVVTMGFDWVRLTSYVGLPLIICHLAQRYCCGWKPALWGCLVLVAHNAAHAFKFTASSTEATVAWGYRFSLNGPDLTAALVPLAIFVLHTAWNLRAPSHEEAQIS